MVNKYLSFITEFNSGSSCGIVSGDSLLEQLILIIGPIMLIGIVCLYYSQEHPIASAFIIAGGVSNLYDRIMHKGVIDFILIKFYGMSFPIFNIADLYISVGILILSYSFFYDT